jgi:large subunit ribosomal protein L6
MSRIGKAPITVPKGVEVSFLNDVVTVKGPKGVMSVGVSGGIKGSMSGVSFELTRSNDEKATKALHGLYRSLVSNAVVGVSSGFTKSLELVGVGYRASVAGSNLELNLGFSHPVIFAIPAGVDVKVEKQTLVVVGGIDKSLIGQVAAKIRDLRPPEPYLGKGVKYVGEVLRRKEGKSAGK